MAENKKGGMEFQFLPKKYSKCPYCGSPISNYRNYHRTDWNESVDYECGFSIRSNTPIIFQEQSPCKNSKVWKELVTKRLEELKIIKTYTNEILTDKKLIKELNEKYYTIESNIKDWWDN